MRKIFYLLILSPIFLGISCKKIVDGINQNPNEPTDADAVTMLPGVETATMLFHGGDVARTTGTWSGYFTGELLQSNQIQNYNVGAKDFDASWNLVYGGVVKNCRLMREKARATNNLGLIGISQLLEAHIIGTAADLWGDIPFTQSFDANFDNPEYDPQVDVYVSVQNLLDSAIKNFENVVNSGGNSGLGGQDLFFSGALASFIPVANTLKARNFLHTKEYELALQYALKGISSQSDNLMADYPGSTKENSNPWYQYVEVDRLGSLDGKDAYLVSLINPLSQAYRGNAKTNEAARFSYYFTGSTPELNTNSQAFFAANTSFPLVSYAENLLIIAESSARINGFVSGLSALNNYREYLNSGGYLPGSVIENNDFEFLPYTDIDFTPGGIVNPNPAGLTEDEALLKNIIEERYIAFTGQIEGFNDLRRLEKEQKVRVNVPPNRGDKIPQRFLYPQDEINGNSSVPNPIPDLFSPTTVNQ